MFSKSRILWTPVILLFLINIIFIFILGGFLGGIAILVALCILGVFFSLLPSLMGMSMSYIFYRKIFPGILFGLISTLLAILSLPLIISIAGYTINTQYPARLATYTISNGDKTVVFQSMAHMGGRKFYVNVRSQMKEYYKQGYKVYFEGVKMGTPENAKKLIALLGSDFYPEIYKDTSRILGLRSQDEYLGHITLLQVEGQNVDLSVDDLIEVYEASYGKITPNAVESITPGSSIRESIRVYDRLSLGQRKIVHNTAHAVMNITMRYQEQLLSSINSESSFLSEIIISLRDAHLSKFITESDDSNIDLLYGSLHFQGVLKNLQEQDSSWKITKTEYKQVIDN